MLEIEAKAWARSFSDIEKRLEELGASYLGEEVQKDTYFQHPERDFVKTDEALRIRDVDGKFTLTYKGPKLDKLTKTREELNVDIQDRKAMEEVLFRLGFRAAAKVEKRRRNYRAGEYRVMLDEVKGIGDFLEIEKEAQEYEPEELIAFLGELGIKEDAVERRSYLEILTSKRGQPGRS